MAGDPTCQRWIVLDTGALIAGTDALYALGGLTEGVTGASVASLAPDERAIFYVTPDVATETRDAQARARLQALDRVGCVVQCTPSAEAVAAVAQAAKNAGDYPVLSAADLRVLALTWMLEVERNGHRFLTEVPKATAIGELRRMPGVSFDEVERWEREEREKKERQELEGDGWTTVQIKKTEPVKKTKKRKKTKKKQASEIPQKEGETQRTVISGEVLEPSSVPKGFNITNSGQRKTSEAANGEEGRSRIAAMDNAQLKPESVNAESSNASPYDELHSKLNLREANAAKSSDEPHDAARDAEETDAAKLEGLEEATMFREEVSDDDGVGWINADNLEEHLARDGGEEEMTAEDRKRVACVTTDFAMQNTMLQMGLKLLSVDGRRTIRQIRRFALRCQSCSNVTRELQRKFCDKCGNATLHRVAFKVDKKGVARVFLNPKKKPVLRGTKYPIPMPRGGRHNKDLILCEDQIDPVKQRRLDKQRERQNVDVLDPSNFYNAGAKFNPHDRPLIVGYGKRNPNQVRPTSKGKR